MSCETTWTTAHIAALEAAIADGVKSVQYSDRTVVYRDLDEMMQTLAMIKSKVCADATTAGRFTKLFATSSKGLG